MVSGWQTEELPRRVERMGDPAAEPRAEVRGSFETFFRIEYRAVVRVVMYAGASLEDAEDAASAAMLEAYLAWSVLEHPGAWVRTAAVHTFVNNARRDRRRPVLEEQAVRQARGDTGTDTAEAGGRVAVLRALRTLPPVQRMVMALALDGHIPAEIADILRMNPVSVRSNLRHARVRLQQVLTV